ncbi:MAG: hypothetical protein JWM93_1378 [Frankiales bacterium]|nr:hypothetical protein [Frankiales bacterium]
MSRPRRNDEGLTLVELLITVAMMGLAFSIIVTGMLTYLNASQQHRNAATVQLELQKYADLVAKATYPATCGTAYAIAYTPPANVTLTSAVVTLWTPASSTFATPWTAGCTDTGLQRVRITMGYSDGQNTHAFTGTADVVKRK